MTLPPPVELRNLTPHEIVLETPSGTLHLPPTGVVARCDTTREVLGHVSVDEVNVPITHVRVEDCENIPPPREGVMLIVSRIVAEARPDREDLLIPDDAVRDSDGRIVAVRALARINPA